MTANLRRREFITLLGGAATGAWPNAAGAQQPAMPVVGFLYVGSPETSANQLAGFRKGLLEAGLVDGRNVVTEFRFAHNEPARLPELAVDLMRRRAAVIVTQGIAASLAAKTVTATIPIVIAIGGDPLEAGLVASFNRPGGNITGVTFMGEELGSKHLGLLHELLPRSARFGVLLNPANPSNERRVVDLQTAAAVIGKQIEVRSAGTSDALDVAFASFVEQKTDALLVSPDGFFANRRVQFATLAAHHHLPVIYSQREFPEVGGMMSYGANIADQMRHAGLYAGRILKGDKPADLPVLQPTKFEFVVNQHTVKTLGLSLSPGLLAIADEVIE